MADDIERELLPMTDEQIKHMVDRFLGWRLPADFSPDDGISFDPIYNKHLPNPPRHEPTGTNLFDATQAEAMVRYMVEGMPGEEWRPISELRHGMGPITIIDPRRPAQTPQGGSDG